MIFADAIEDALDRPDVGEIERAFRVLVIFPNGEEVGGALTTKRLDDVLGRVAAALLPDQAIAPAAMLEVVRERLGSPVPLHPQGTYADAALLVQRYRDKWRAVFVAHLSGGEP